MILQRRKVRRPGSRTAGVALTVAAATLLCACAPGGGSGDTGGESVQLNLNLVYSADSAIYAAASDVADAIAKGTDNRVTMKVYPDSQLGSNEDAIEQALNGSPTVAHVSASAIALQGGVPAALAASAAYMVPGTDFKYEERLCASDLYKGWVADAEKNGFVLLAFDWMLGARNIISTDPDGYPEPQDLDGVPIRIPAGEQFSTFFNALGDVPITLDPSETYTGMQQGTTVAADGPLSQMVDWSLDELGKSVTLTQHIVEITGFATGVDTWNKISVEDQQVVRDAFYAGGKAFTEATNENSSKLRKTMEDEGIKFVEVDQAAYAEIAKDAFEHSESAKDWPAGLLDQLSEIMNG